MAFDLQGTCPSSQKRIWGTVGPFRREEEERIDERIALLRIDWAGRGRELRKLDKIKWSA